MALKSLSAETKRLARKTGKLPKAPRKPKQSASLLSMKNYIARYNTFVDRVNKMASDAREKETLRKQIHKV